MPDRRKTLEVCHINLLKLYVTHAISLSVDTVSITSSVGQGTSEVSEEMVENLDPVDTGEINGSIILAKYDF